MLNANIASSNSLFLADVRRKRWNNIKPSRNVLMLSIFTQLHLEQHAQQRALTKNDSMLFAVFVSPTLAFGTPESEGGWENKYEVKKYHRC